MKDKKIFYFILLFCLEYSFLSQTNAQPLDIHLTVNIPQPPISYVALSTFTTLAVQYAFIKIFMGDSDLKKNNLLESTITSKDLNRSLPEQLTLLINRYKNPAKYSETPHCKGFMLHGETGSGKTHCMKALAGEGIPVLYYPSSELLNKYVGETESIMRKIYADAAKLRHQITWKQRLLLFNPWKHKSWTAWLLYIFLQKHEPGHPFVILCFDEIDSILRDRKHSSEYSISMINQMLTLMDGAKNFPGVMTCFLTNNPEVLDSASIRGSRIDWKIHMPRPTKDENEKIISACFDSLKLKRSNSAHNLLRQMCGITPATATALARTCSTIMASSNKKTVSSECLQKAYSWVTSTEEDKAPSSMYA